MLPNISKSHKKKSFYDLVTFTLYGYNNARKEQQDFKAENYRHFTKIKLTSN